MHIIPAYREDGGGGGSSGAAPCLVSTIIPAFNARPFIERALQSALAQNVPDCEIVVVDDGSTDGTREIVARYAARGVRLVCHERRSGAAAARNTGIALARGQYVAFLDADDEWLPEKLARQLAAITAAPDMTFVSCRANLFDETGRDTGDIYRGAIPATGTEGWRRLLAYPCVATPSVLARADALRTAGGFNKWLPVGEDQDMWIKLSFLGEVGHIPETLVRVHSTPNSLSKSKIRNQAGYVLPMVISYVERNRDKLSKADAHAILEDRFTRVGQVAYANGEWRFGLATLLRAVRYGGQPLAIFLYVVRAAVPRWFKRLIQARRAAA